jgi:hypothetical protein
LRSNETDFSRERKLDIVRAVGLQLHMAINRNQVGYSIAAQDFFAVAGFTGRPPSEQSVSEAQNKLTPGMFKLLLEKAYSADSEDLWLGHRVIAADGTKLTLPRSQNILEYVETPKTNIGVPMHYPQALMVTAISTSSGQPLGMAIGKHRDSERGLLLDVLANAKHGDVWLLDRGLGGAAIYYEFLRREIDFVHRVQTSGASAPRYVQEFIASKRQSRVIGIPIQSQEGETAILIRLVRGRKDSEGKRMIFVTSLLDDNRYSNRAIRELYRERWGIETLYNRIKNVIQVEKFHSRSWQGVQREIYAHLVVLSLAALIDVEASRQLRLDRRKASTSFKFAVNAVKRNFTALLGSATNLSKGELDNLVDTMIADASRLVVRKRPGRNYPRVSRQPIKSHNLCKSKKLREFSERNKS